MGGASCFTARLRYFPRLGAGLAESVDQDRDINIPPRPESVFTLAMLALMTGPAQAYRAPIVGLLTNSRTAPEPDVRYLDCGG